MALTLTSSWGGSSDTSYVLLDEANDYIGTDSAVGYKLDPTPWTTIGSIQRTRMLLAATRTIDNASNYVGDRQFYNQTLEFPRVPAGDEVWPWVNRTMTAANTYNVYLLEQKRRVKQAVIEQAFAFARDGDRDQHTTNQIHGIRSYSESTGPVSESYSYGGSVLPLCLEAMELLRPYKDVGIRLVRG